MESKSFEKSKREKIWGYVFYGILIIIFCGILCAQNLFFNEQNVENNVEQLQTEQTEKN